MPHSVQEAARFPLPQNSLCYCLLEDDSLITKVSVVARQLFTEPKADESATHVRLAVNVTIIDENA